jgi:hypothetical protein
MLRETTISNAGLRTENVLRYCKGDEPRSSTVGVRALGIPAYSSGSIVRRGHETFGRRSKVESVFSSYKQRSRVYYNPTFNIQLQRKAEEGGQKAMVEASPATSQLLLCPSPSIIYYNQLR